jgi:hypothetical protein
MNEKFISGIEEGELDKPENEACLLLYITILKMGKPP